MSVHKKLELVFIKKKLNSLFLKKQFPQKLDIFQMPPGQWPYYCNTVYSPVPDFTISVYSSSCSSLFSGLILPSFSICFLASHSASGMQINGKRKQRIENEAKQEIITVHELPYTEIRESWTSKHCI